MVDKKVYHLSEDEARGLSEDARRRCLPTFIQLSDWRNTSGSSRRNIPYEIREEARRKNSSAQYVN